MKEVLPEDSLIKISAKELSSIYESLTQDTKTSQNRGKEGNFPLIYLLDKRIIKVLNEKSVPIENLCYSVFTKYGKILFTRNKAINSDYVTKDQAYRRVSISKRYMLNYRLPQLRSSLYINRKVFNNDDLYEDNVIGRSESINKKTSYFEYKIPINKRTLRYYKKALFITNSQSVSIIDLL